MKLHFSSSFEPIRCTQKVRKRAVKMRETSSATVAVCCLSTPRTSCSSALVALALRLTIISQPFTAIQFQSDSNRSFLSAEINRSSGSYPNRSAAVWKTLKCQHRASFLVLRDSCVVGVSLCDGLPSSCCLQSSRLRHE